MDRREREALARRIMERSRAEQAEQTEVIVLSDRSGLTRFTHNAIHQSVASYDVGVRVRAVHGGRTGVAATNDLSDAGIDRVVTRACEIAALAPVDPDAQPLRDAATAEDTPGAYVDATAHATAEDRANAVHGVFDAAERGSFWAAGYVTTSCGGITIANSRGTMQSHDGTDCGINVKQNGASSTGFAERYSADVRDVDGGAVGSIAAQKATSSADPIAVEPGEWTVIMEPAAFGELLAHLGEHFSAQSYDEGSSFFSERLGERCAGDNVTLVDDVRHPLNPGMPFDFEGTPTQRVTLIDAGAATGLVTDARWAAKLGRDNTGHALPEPNAYGPQAAHLVMQPGAESHDDLIASTERGLLVSRLWYVRTVDQRQTIVTGMTRDGTFLIENGKITRGVKNMRFNQSIVEALRLCAFSRELARTASYSYAMVVPSVRFERFCFSSGTEF